MCMVLRRGLEKTPKMLARSVIARNDKVGALSSHFYRILRVLKRHLSHQKMFRVRKTLCRRTNEHQMANLRGITKRKVESNVTAMRTGHQRGLANLAIMQQSRYIIGFEVGFGRDG